MKIRPDGATDEAADMAKFIVAFRNFKKSA
jgi:hypothetical protein